MSKFITIKSKAIPMRNINVDTDQIIPARYLLMITKDGYGEHLFQDWRYNEDGSENKNFILNNPVYKGARILVAGDNFGSGSSREHAVWALKQYGIDVVISTSFSDIFRNNANGNGLLVITVDKVTLEQLFTSVEVDPSFEITVNLQKQEIILENGKLIRFEINSFVKEKLINGYDDISYILSKEELIKKYEK